MNRLSWGRRPGLCFHRVRPGRGACRIPTALLFPGPPVAQVGSRARLGGVLEVEHQPPLGEIDDGTAGTLKRLMPLPRSGHLNPGKLEDADKLVPPAAHQKVGDSLAWRVLLKEPAPRLVDSTGSCHPPATASVAVSGIVSNRIAPATGAPPTPLIDAYSPVTTSAEFIPQVLNKFLDCGDLEQGFARVRSDHCKHEYLLAFPCKGRWFCASSHQKKVQPFCLTHSAPSHTLHIMTSLLQTGLNGHLPAPPEKRFLISYLDVGYCGAKKR